MGAAASRLFKLMMLHFLKALLEGLVSLVTPFWFWILMPIDLLDLRLGESGELTFDVSVWTRDPATRQFARLPPS